MVFNAKARYISFSPYKLRPLADIIRGKQVNKALGILSTSALQRSVPLIKMIQSAIANAKNRDASVAVDLLVICKITIDQGPSRRSFKPGAMGRSEVRKKRFSHMSVELCLPKDLKE